MRDLVAHVVEEERWGPPLLAGEQVADIDARLSGDLVGDDPVRAWRDAATGRDDHLPIDLVRACAAWFDAHEQAWREAGEIGPPAPVAPDAGPQARLLARFGRHAGVTARS